MKPLHGAIRGAAEVSIGPKSFDGDAIDRADAGTFVTTDAVIGFHVEAVTPFVRNRNGFLGILNGDRAVGLGEVGIVLDADWLSGAFALTEILSGKEQAFGQGSENLGTAHHILEEAHYALYTSNSLTIPEMTKSKNAIGVSTFQLILSN